MATDGAQRVIRLAKGESTKRSEVNADLLATLLRERGVGHLAQSDADELWLMADASDLRKPYASEMPDLMQVKALAGSVVPGYRTMNVPGVTPGYRGLLYHHLFSSKSKDVDSQPLEVQRTLTQVSQSVRSLKERMSVSWIMDRDFDDVAAWRTVWEQEEHVVCRIKHKERLIEYRTTEGAWREGDVATAGQHLWPMARARAQMVVRLGRQKKKRQEVTAEISSCPWPLTYDRTVRREGEGEVVQKGIWLVKVEVVRSHLQPCWLITDWPVGDADEALRIFRMYRQRWAVEDGFKCIKEALGWEEAPLLHLKGIRTLVALAWVAVGFLYELDVTLESEDVRLLARLGGWADREDNPPGKILATRGLGRAADMLATQTSLAQYSEKHGGLPPCIAAWIEDQSPPHLRPNVTFHS